MAAGEYQPAPLEPGDEAWKVLELLEWMSDEAKRARDAGDVVGAREWWENVGTIMQAWQRAVLARAEIVFPDVRLVEPLYYTLARMAFMGDREVGAAPIQREVTARAVAWIRKELPSVTRAVDPMLEAHLKTLGARA